MWLLRWVCEDIITHYFSLFIFFPAFMCSWASVTSIFNHISGLYTCSSHCRNLVCVSGVVCVCLPSAWCVCLCVYLCASVCVCVCVCMRVLSSVSVDAKCHTDLSSNTSSFSFIWAPPLQPPANTHTHINTWAIKMTKGQHQHSFCRMQLKAPLIKFPTGNHLTIQSPVGQGQQGASASSLWMSVSQADPDGGSRRLSQ